MKNFKKPEKYKNVLKKYFFQWFSIKIIDPTGCLIFLATPKSRKKQSHELATLWNDQVQDLLPPKNGRVQNLPPLNSQELGTLPFFEGGKSWT